MDNQQQLRDEKIGILLLKYSVPAILAMMVTSLYNTVDRVFIGSIKDIGALAISGLGVTMLLFTIGSAKASMFLSLLRQVIILIPLIILVPKIYGINGVWISQPIADIGSMFIMVLFLLKEFKKMNLPTFSLKFK